MTPLFVAVLLICLAHSCLGAVPSVTTLVKGETLAIRQSFDISVSNPWLHIRVPYSGKQYEMLVMKGGNYDDVRIWQSYCILPRTFIDSQEAINYVNYRAPSNISACRPTGSTCDVYFSLQVRTTLLTLNITLIDVSSPAFMKAVQVDGAAADIVAIPPDQNEYTIAMFNASSSTPLYMNAQPSSLQLQVSKFPREYKCRLNSFLWADGDPQYVYVANSGPTPVSFSFALQSTFSTLNEGSRQSLSLSSSLETRLVVFLGALGEPNVAKLVSLRLEFAQALSGNLTVAYSYNPSQRRELKTFTSPSGTIVQEIPYCQSAPFSNDLHLMLQWKPNSGSAPAQVSVTVTTSLPTVQPLQSGAVVTAPAGLTTYRYQGPPLRPSDTLIISAQSTSYSFGTAPLQTDWQLCGTLGRSVWVYPACLSGNCDPTGTQQFFLTTAANQISFSIQGPRVAVPGTTITMDQTNASAIVFPTDCRPLVYTFKILSGFAFLIVADSNCVKGFGCTKQQIYSGETAYISDCRTGLQIYGYDFTAKIEFFANGPIISATYPDDFNRAGGNYSITAVPNQVTLFNFDVSTQNAFRFAVYLNSTQPRSWGVDQKNEYGSFMQDSVGDSSFNALLYKTPPGRPTRFQHLLLGRNETFTAVYRKIAFGPAEICDSSWQLPAVCAPYAKVTAFAGGFTEARLNESIDLLSAVFPNDVSGNTTCYTNILQMMCLGLPSYRCDEKIGTFDNIIGVEVCRERCQVAVASCESSTSGNLIGFCRDLPTCPPPQPPANPPVRPADPAPVVVTDGSSHLGFHLSAGIFLCLFSVLLAH